MDEVTTEQQAVPPADTDNVEVILKSDEGAGTTKSVPARDLESIMADAANRMNGYPYITASCLMTYDDKAEDPKIISNLAKRLRLGFLMKGYGDKNKFIELFVGQPIVHVWAMARLPTLSNDGCYNNIDIDGNMIPEICVGEYPLLKQPKDFTPFVIVKNLDPKTGKSSFSKIEGNPYREVTNDEVKAVAEMFQK